MISKSQAAMALPKTWLSMSGASPAGSGSAVQADTNNQIEGDFDKKGLYGAVLLL